MKKNKNIEVKDIDLTTISFTDLYSAKKLVYRGKAAWLEAGRSIVVFVLNKEFNALKKHIVEEENRICYICNKTIPEYEKATVDHLISVKQFGKDTRDNLRCCCIDCNKDKEDLNIYQYILKLKNENKLDNIKKIKNIKKSLRSVKCIYEICTSP